MVKLTNNLKELSTRGGNRLVYMDMEKWESI